MAARKTVPTVESCERSDRANREDWSPLHILFLFLYFLFCFFCYFFALFCDDIGHFFKFICYFLCLQIYDKERRKRKRNLLIGQPQGSLSERIDTQCAFFDLKITFSCGLPICRLILDQFEWCIAAAGMCALVVCVIVNVVLYPAVM